MTTELEDRANVAASKLSLLSALITEGGDDFFAYSGVSAGFVAILDEAAEILRKLARR